jgi:putative hydroxymethylpyrimidine transport system substrate-binding protein
MPSTARAQSIARMRINWVVGLVTVAFAIGALIATVQPAHAQTAATPEKMRLILDWFPNADHVPLHAARDLGLFKKHGLEMEFVPPADPNDPLKLVAAGQAAFAISYEPSVIIARSEGLPIKAIGIVVDHTLSCLLYLQKSGIRTAADLRGKRVGYSVETIDLPLLRVVAAAGGLKEGDYTPVNIRFNLTSSLLTGQVDGVMGAFWNYELLEVRRESQAGGYLKLEDYGVPAYSEMIVISSDTFLAAHRDTARRFVAALQEGIVYAKAHPEEAFAMFAKDNPEAKEDLDHEAFTISVPLFATTQVQSREQWAHWTQFARQHGLIAKDVSVDDVLANVAAK